MRKLLILFVAAALVLTSCTFNRPGSGSKEGAKEDIGLTEGKVAPDFTLKNIDGKEVKLSDYRGKIVVVNFFGVWCPWCVKEMPGFVKVFNEYKDKNVELLVVDVGDTNSKVKNYLTLNAFNIKPVMDVDQKASNLYNVNSYPTTFILDDKGIIKKVVMGYTEEEQLKSILNSLIKK